MASGQDMSSACECFLLVSLESKIKTSPCVTVAALTQSRIAETSAGEHVMLLPAQEHVPEPPAPTPAPAPAKTPPAPTPPAAETASPGASLQHEQKPQLSGDRYRTLDITWYHCITLSLENWGLPGTRWPADSLSPLRPEPAFRRDGLNSLRGVLREVQNLRVWFMGDPWS